MLFNVPETCIKGDEDGNPCEDWKATGQCKHALTKDGLRRKRRIEKYNKYREDVFRMAQETGFELPVAGWSVFFYIPVPTRWSKVRKQAVHGQLNLRRPDASNFLKAFEDSLTGSDHQIAQYSGIGKFWINPDQIEDEALRGGYIEIWTGQPLYNPFNVILVDEGSTISMEDIHLQRERRRLQREAKKRQKEKLQKKLSKKRGRKSRQEIISTHHSTDKLN